MSNLACFSLILCLAAASYGCRACSSCYDYSSPVANSAYAGQRGRAGSALSGNLFQARLEQEAAPIPAVTDMSDLEPVEIVPPEHDAEVLPVVEYAVAEESESNHTPLSDDIPVGVNLLR